MNLPSTVHLHTMAAVDGRDCVIWHNHCVFALHWNVLAAAGGRARYTLIRRATLFELQKLKGLQSPPSPLTLFLFSLLSKFNMFISAHKMGKHSWNSRFLEFFWCQSYWHTSFTPDLCNFQVSTPLPSRWSLFKVLEPLELMLLERFFLHMWTFCLCVVIFLYVVPCCPV